MLRTQAPGIKLRSHRVEEKAVEKWSPPLVSGMWMAPKGLSFPPSLPALPGQSLYLGAGGSLKDGWAGGSGSLRQGSSFCGLLSTTARLRRSENQEGQVSLT